MRAAEGWRDYELIDASAGRRLERWGEHTLVRPDPQVIWRTDEADARWRGADSARMLAEVARRVRADGWQIVNIDSTISAQAPRLAAHARQMAENIARATGIAAAQVNVKAKTGERLGYIGRGEGIAAQAIALLMAASAP